MNCNTGVEVYLDSAYAETTGIDWLFCNTVILVSVNGNMATVKNRETGAEFTCDAKHVRYRKNKPIEYKKPVFTPRPPVVIDSKEYIFR